MYRHLNDPSRWVLHEVLDDHAHRRGNDTFVTVIGEGALTYEGARTDATRMAGHLGAAGIGCGDAVAVVMPNGLDFIRVWLALGQIGAVMVPINTALTGDFLASQLRDSGARTVVATGEAMAGVGEVLHTVPDLRLLSLAGWESHPPLTRAVTTAVSSRDIACVMYTSGTTGP